MQFEGHPFGISRDMPSRRTEPSVVHYGVPIVKSPQAWEVGIVIVKDSLSAGCGAEPFPIAQVA